MYSILIINKLHLFPTCFFIVIFFKNFDEKNILSSKESRSTQGQAERTDHVIGKNESAANDEAFCSNSSKPEEKLKSDEQTEVKSPEDTDSSTDTDKKKVTDNSTSSSNQNQVTQSLQSYPVVRSAASKSEESAFAHLTSINQNISESSQTGVVDTQGNIESISGTNVLNGVKLDSISASNESEITNTTEIPQNHEIIPVLTSTGTLNSEQSTNTLSTNENISESRQTKVEDTASSNSLNEFSTDIIFASNQNEPVHSLERDSALASIGASNSGESTNVQSMSTYVNTSELSPTGIEHTNRESMESASSKPNEFSCAKPRLTDEINITSPLTSHEDGSLLSRCSDTKDKKETLATRIPLQILLLGDSGAGKTSLFKLMKLYADMNGFFSEETFKKLMQNIFFVPSSTATTITYDAIYIENLAITVIDTPGFDETTSKDGKSWVENISHEVQRLKNLNCICLVINGTESRLTWHTSDVIKRMSSFLPKDLFQNVVVFFTHTSDDFSLTFAEETLTTELGYPLKHTHVIDNPYARYCKANRRRRKIKSSLINDEFPEAFETLSQVLRTIKNFTKADDSQTDIFGNFSVLKDRIETCVDNLSKFNNEMKAQKVVLKEKEELEENKKTLKKTLVTERVSYTEIQSMSLDVPRDTEMQNMSLDVPKSKAEFLLECMIELQTIGTHNPSQLNFVVDVKKKLDEMSELRNMGRLDDIWKKIDEKVTCIISKT